MSGNDEVRQKRGACSGGGFSKRLRQGPICYLDKAGDAQKARMTGHFALALAAVTMIGAATQARRPEIFHFASCIIFFGFVGGVLLENVTTIPFLGKALSSANLSKEPEFVGFPGLASVNADSSGYGLLGVMTDAKARRKKTQRGFVTGHLLLNARFIGSILFAEGALFIWIQSLPLASS